MKKLVLFCITIITVAICFTQTQTLEALTAAEKINSGYNFSSVNFFIPSSFANNTKILSRRDDKDNDRDNDKDNDRDDNGKDDNGNNNGSFDTFIPEIESPADFAVSVSLTPALKALQLSNPNVNNHKASHWQISTIPFNDPDFSKYSLVFDNLTTVDKHQITIFHGILQPEITYYWRVRYNDSIDGWSQWSNFLPDTSEEPGSEFLTKTDTSDINSDGTPDDQEIEGSVDKNNDNINDHDQDEIRIIKSLVNGNLLGVETSSGIITNLANLNLNELENIIEKPKNYEFLDGMLNFSVQNQQFEGKIEITFYLSKIFGELDRWYKYTGTAGWVDYSGMIVNGIGTKKITIEYKDGSFGDNDGIENGRIVDLSGPAYNRKNIEKPVNSDIKKDTDIVIDNSKISEEIGCFISNLIN